MGQSNRKEVTCTSGIDNCTLPDTDVIPTCDMMWSSAAVHPISSIDFDSTDVAPNQIQKPKSLSINGRSRSNSSKTSLRLSGSHHTLTPAVTNSGKNPSTLNDLEIEFHRVLSDPVVKPVLQRPDTIRSKSSSVGTLKQSYTDQSRPLSPLRSQLSYHANSFETPYGNSHKICDTRDNSRRIVSLHSARIEFESRDDSNEQVENPLDNNHRDRFDDSCAHSDSSILKN